MDPAIPVRSLIEEPTVETGILAVPQLEVPRFAVGDLEVPSWLVAVILLAILLSGTLLYYHLDYLRPGRTKRSAELSILELIDKESDLQTRR